MPIDRSDVVHRHDPELTEPDSQHVLSVGNGDFAYTADITGMQTFTGYHDPRAAAMAGRVAVNTATQTTWGWHAMPNPDEWTLDDAMSEYDTARGPVRYPDRFDMQAAARGQITDEQRPGAWLNANPQRLDLGRIGLLLRRSSDNAAETDPEVLTDTRQRLDLWTGLIISEFGYDEGRLRIETVAASATSTVAFRLAGDLLDDGRAQVRLRFPYASDGFFQTDDWDAPDRHETRLVDLGAGRARVERRLDDTAYSVEVAVAGGALKQTDRHEVVIVAAGGPLEVVVRFTPVPEDGDPPTFEQVEADSAAGWRAFWSSGAAIDLSRTADPRAMELERRAVLSQYLTRVHSAGVLPPQETGLATNSWQGKFHLEMHLWHGAHFATWGRPELLTRSLDWYREILPEARATAQRQGYPGARWPKQVGPDGRESPDPTGSLLIWQQPHILYLLELTRRATPVEQQAALVHRFADVVHETGAFMAAFPTDIDGVLHLGPPVMPAQEFYDPRQTTDPTFELAYWWWGLELAQRWREHAAASRLSEWDDVQQRLAGPRVSEGRYVPVGSSGTTRRDDHPALLAALGLVPPTPLIDPRIMSATLDDVLREWDWPTAWGWDFPMMAMTAVRLGRPEVVLDALLRDEGRNRYTAVGHSPQIGAILPIYLPANGALLAAVSMMIRTDDATTGGFPDTWKVQHEGFVPWP